MRKLSIVALGAAAAVALAGCAAEAPEATTGAEIRVWLVGTDTPQEARDYLVETFEAENPGNTLVIEEQAWGGLVDKLTTSLSGSDSPDVVEVGNTQAAAFTSAGAFLDLTDDYEALGGDDLLPGFVEAGTYDGTFYAAPYYSGARVVFYDTAMYDALGLSVPTTLEEYVANGQAIAEANAGVSGIYFPGQDWYNALPYVWEQGGEIATFENGEWVAGFSSPESIAGLEMVQEVMTTASVAPKDGNEAEAQVPFCAGEVGHLSAPSWFKWSILAPADADAPGCPEKEATLGVFALPRPRRRTGAGLRRRLEHRRLGELGSPRAREEGARHSAERRVPVDHGRRRPRARARLARRHDRHRRDRSGDLGGGEQRQADSRLARVGRGRGGRRAAGLLRADRAGRRRRRARG